MRGEKQARLAEALDLSPGYVSSLAQNKASPSPKLLEEIAEYLDIDPGWLIVKSRPVPVVGRVGAGSEVELVDAYARGDGLYHVDSPADLPARDVVAVEVVGDSMEPLITQGDVLFFSRDFVGLNVGAVGTVSIINTHDGRVLVKQLLQGREKGLFDLYSANDRAAPPEYGVRLNWATPLRRHIKKQDVEIISI